MMKNTFIKWLFALLVCLAMLPASAMASSNFTDSELDTLVSTIALYPDPLLTQVLTAATHGNQIPSASAWANDHRDLKGENLVEAVDEADLPYDASVKALIAFPSVLQTMATYRAWSSQLGDAVISQKNDVIAAIQRLRSKAYEHGQLKTDEQVRVKKSRTIVIEPVRTEYIYVPVYNPRIVYEVYADGYSSVTYRSWGWIGPWIDVDLYGWYRPAPPPPERRFEEPPPRRMEPMGGFRNPPPSNGYSAGGYNAGPSRMDNGRREEGRAQRRDDYRPRESTSPQPASASSSTYPPNQNFKHPGSGGNGNFERIKR